MMNGYSECKVLSGMDTLSGEATLCQYCLPPFRKGVFSKRKEFSSVGSILFPIRVEHFRR